MKQYDIEQLIVDEVTARQREDRAHLAELQRRMEADSGTFMQHTRRLSIAAAIATLLTVPSAYAAVLPTSEPERVVCNQRGEEAMVMARACESMGKEANCMICNETL